MSPKTPNPEEQPSLFDLLPEAEAAAFVPEQVVETPLSAEEKQKRDFFRQLAIKRANAAPGPVEAEKKPEVNYTAPKIGETSHQTRVTPLPELSNESQGVKVRRDAFYNDALLPLLETMPTMDQHFWAYSIMQDERDHQNKYKGADHIPAGPKELYLRSQRDKFVNDQESKNGQRPSAESVSNYIRIREERLRREDHAYSKAKVEYEWHAKEYFKKYYDTLLQNLPLSEVRKHDDNADIVDHIYAIYEGADFRRVFENTLAGEYLEITSNGSNKKPSAKFVDKIKDDKKLSKLGFADKREARKQMAKNAALARETLAEEKQVYDKRDQIKVGEAQPARIQNVASVMIRIAEDTKQAVLSDDNSYQGMMRQIRSDARKRREEDRTFYSSRPRTFLEKSHTSFGNIKPIKKRSQPAKKEVAVEEQVINIGRPQIDGQIEISDSDLSRSA